MLFVELVVDRKVDRYGGYDVGKCFFGICVVLFLVFLFYRNVQVSIQGYSDFFFVFEVGIVWWIGNVFYEVLDFVGGLCIY